MAEIITNPPKLFKNREWTAHFKGEEDGWVGTGGTKEDAIQDLLEISGEEE